VQEQLNAQFYNHRYGLNATAYLANRLKLHTDANVINNAGRADGCNQTVPIWNAYAGWMLFKPSNGEFTFNVTDILNLNKCISRNTGDNFIDDSFVNVLRRFYMVTMVNLTRFGGPPPRNAPSRGTAGALANRLFSCICPTHCPMPSYRYPAMRCIGAM
jgi:hypothetical protein